MEPPKLEDHPKRFCPGKTDKDLTYFKTLNKKLQKRVPLDSIFASTLKRDNDCLRASHNIFSLIGKSGKPHTIREQLMLAFKKVLKPVLRKPARDTFKAFALNDKDVLIK
ncbi:hypothetical protein Trydic_g8351 [Trypoxylus dichotomus]